MNCFNESFNKLSNYEIEISFGKIANYNELLNKTIVNNLNSESNLTNEKVFYSFCYSFNHILRNKNMLKKSSYQFIPDFYKEKDIVNGCKCKYCPNNKTSAMIIPPFNEELLNPFSEYIEENAGKLISCTGLYFSTETNNLNSKHKMINYEKYLPTINTCKSPTVLNYKNTKPICHNYEYFNGIKIYRNKCKNQSHFMPESSVNDGRLNHFLLKLKNLMKLIRKFSNLGIIERDEVKEVADNPHPSPPPPPTSTTIDKSIPKDDKRRRKTLYNKQHYHSI
ncbi:unnamed protein product [Heterobilharzia americana]|nr:unnamed protein product [Heterobilharzia americana]CAH8573733.1 unnamed protein product [Heterobilharzia americana]